MKKYCLWITAISFAGCVHVNGELKGLYGYREKTANAHPGLLQNVPDSALCRFPKPQKPLVLVSNGKALKACVSQSAHAIVFVWDPLCKGARCYPPNAIQAACRKRKLELYVVAEFYDGGKMMRNYGLDHPIIGVDTDFYRSNLTQTYLKRFFEDLIGQPFERYNIFRFDQGKLTRAFDDIEQI